MADKKIMIMAAVLIALLVAGFLMWKYKFSKNTANQIPTIEPVDISKDISNKIVNPSLPQTNPFGAQTNPFKNVYKNPF